MSSLLATVCSFGQKLEVISGIGFPDVLHIGVNASITKKSALGINFGWLPSSEAKGVQVTLEHQTNSASSKKNSGRPTWYFGERLTYSYEDNHTVVWRTLFLTPEIGRHLYITDEFGVNADLGIFISFWQEEDPSPRGDEGDYRDLFEIVSPTARIQLFYKL